VLRTALPHEAGQCMERRQSLVAGCDRALTRFFQILEKQAQKIGGKIDHGQTVYGGLQLSGNEGTEQGKRISVTVLRVARQVPLYLSGAPVRIAVPRVLIVCSHSCGSSQT
jgi:hypothetical protein